VMLALMSLRSPLVLLLLYSGVGMSLNKDQISYQLDNLLIRKILLKGALSRMIERRINLLKTREN